MLCDSLFLKRIRAFSKNIRKFRKHNSITVVAHAKFCAGIIGHKCFTPVVEHWLEREIAILLHHEGSIRGSIAP